MPESDIVVILRNTMVSEAQRRLKMIYHPDECSDADILKPEEWHIAFAEKSFATGNKVFPKGKLVLVRHSEKRGITGYDHTNRPVIDIIYLPSIPSELMDEESYQGNPLRLIIRGTSLAVHIANKLEEIT